MAEYIERAGAISALEKIDRESKEEMTIEDVRFCLINLPAAEVAPVRHGRWQTHLGWGWVWRCSCCEYKMWKKEFFKIKRNYCPNCGAKMD